MKILWMEPVMKQMIWGGNRLRTEFGYEIPGEHTGECWAISAHPTGDCRVKIISGIQPQRKQPLKELQEQQEQAERGNLPEDVSLLSELWREHRELFGGMEGEVFPLLTKIIDATADLSIQVHPDNEYAREHENGSLGKTECWYILGCDPGTTIIIGHHARTKEELRELEEAGRFQELIREIPVHPGDFFQINPGCVHAIKGGTLLLETQQSSDITYRLYDYGRLQDGKPRELHLEKSMDVIICPAENSPDEKEHAGAEAARRYIRYQTEDGSFVEHLTTCPYFTVERIGVKGKLSLTEIRETGSVKFDLFSVIAGEGSLGGIVLKKGDHFIVPYGCGEEEFLGEMELIHATP